MTKPLKWCVNWDNLSFKERFLIGTPFIGTDVIAYKDIVRQLKTRTEIDLENWDRFPDKISKIALNIMKLFKTNQIWPNPIFIPEDPADITFALYFDLTDKFDIMPASIDIVQKEYGIELDAEFWEELEKLSFLQAIEIISKVHDRTCNH